MGDHSDRAEASSAFLMDVCHERGRRGWCRGTDEVSGLWCVWQAKIQASTVAELDYCNNAAWSKWVLLRNKK